MKRKPKPAEPAKRPKPTISDVPEKWRMPANMDYEYNPAILYCPEGGCMGRIGWGDRSTLIGFAEYPRGLMQIHECPKCFKKQYFHVSSFDELETIFELLGLKD